MRPALALAAAALAAAALTSPATADDPAADAERNQAVIIEHRSSAGVPVWGPRYAPVTADFFFSMQNPFVSRDAYFALIKLQADHPRRLRIVFRLIDPPAAGSYVAEAALEAHRQGRFFEFVDTYFRNRRHLRRNQLDGLCAEAKVDCDRVEAAIAGSHHTDALERNREHMARLQIRFTRTSVAFNGAEPPLEINNPRGRQPQVLEQQYDAAYAQAERLLARGATLADVYWRALREHELAQPPARIAWDQVDGVHRRPKGATFRDSRLVSAAASKMARHGRGADEPKLVINFFCSFQSQNCGWTWEAIREAMRVYPDEIYLQFNHLFDERDPNQPAVGLAHEAALCAEDQNAFWDFYDYQFGRVRSRPPQQLGESDLRAIAQSLGIDEDELMKCVASGAHGAEVEALRVKARLAGIRRTPSVVINGRLYEGKLTRGPMLRLVASELRPGLLEQLFPVELQGSVEPSGDNR